MEAQGQENPGESEALHMAVATFVSMELSPSMLSPACSSIVCKMDNILWLAGTSQAEP